MQYLKNVGVPAKCSGLKKYCIQATGSTLPSKYKEGSFPCHQFQKKNSVFQPKQTEICQNWCDKIFFQCARLDRLSLHRITKTFIGEAEQIRSFSDILCNEWSTGEGRYWHVVLHVRWHVHLMKINFSFNWDFVFIPTETLELISMLKVQTIVPKPLRC